MNGQSFPALFTVGLGVAVTIAWLLSVGAEIYAANTGGSYRTPLAIHGLMGTIVGAVYASWRVTKRNREDDKRG